MPLCDQCQATTDPDELHEHAGRMLCDDCYMDALNPAKSCDPWATYTASRLPQEMLNPAQEAILELIRRQKAATLTELRQATGLDQTQLERELAALRHMEKLRAAPTPGGGKVFREFHDRD
ncbi:MAG: hypothetical protein KQJ78_13165 [Deltaproteobacteria bacterium]|nr:hypothetical protein [Deltaproteobacteria bacterium]